ncbi:sporulation protein YunB [Paenibacillus sp. F411]|uniref:sporulation protein YunB n=1 Tax=Paenibacillus sp. F411 TaxID=2820239 RepID=UPI001FBB92BB|nr:sporulation protein YunB [Paenibacillus sp. F411]
MFRRKKWGSRRLSLSWRGWPKRNRHKRYRKSAYRPVRSRHGGKPASAGWAPPDKGKGLRLKVRRRWWVGVVFLVLFGVFQLFLYVERNLKPPIMHLAQIRVKQIATEAINKAITSQVTDGKTFDDLVNWKTDSTGKVTGFMLNYAEHLKITSFTTELVQETLESIHEQKEHIPLGQVLKSPVVASFGPKIPVKIEPQGAVKVQLDTRQQEAGINMILVEVFVHIVTEVAVVVPFDMEPQVVETDIPISYMLVVGDVPMYYYDGQGKPVGNNSAGAPSIAIPSPGLTSPDAGDVKPSSPAAPSGNEIVPQPEVEGQTEGTEGSGEVGGNLEHE